MRDAVRRRLCWALDTSGLLVMGLLGRPLFLITAPGPGFIHDLRIGSAAANIWWTIAIALLVASQVLKLADVVGRRPAAVNQGAAAGAAAPVGNQPPAGAAGARPPYESLRDVIHHHGLFVGIGHVVTWLLARVCPFGLLSFLARRSRWRTHFVDQGLDKVRPAWQDAFVLLIALLVAALATLWHDKPSIPLGIILVLWWFLGDVVIYHMGVLWFDDVRPGRTWPQLRVWSHRRVLFQALVDFLKAVLLFALLYRNHVGTTIGFGELLRASYESATGLCVPPILNDVPAYLHSVQVGVSIFLLVVVVATVASAGYGRLENAPSEAPRP